ncbi:L-xylulose reductase-like [Panonychus citri]|uniref:L-xylulose reductase-like n=1 Tax=Panonychus citri TaxID=50023 RepID=UPI0023079DD1|nr:L-xylulose reductase-like [Panonychus citri]XP_053206743.1 L-xylulose reductase-like [Panonychus citri]
MEISVEGKKVLVTGASRGIGRAVTETLVKAGASKVYAVCILKDELDKLASEVNNVHPIHLDLSDWSATEETLSKLEPVDCLVNNAGVLWPTEPGSIKESDYDKIFDVNVKALINVTQIISTKMINSGVKGSIVNLSSIAAKKSHPKYLIYCTSKATVDHITHNFALQLAPKGIRVNAVNPSIVNTPMAVALQMSQEEAEEFRKAIPLGRFIEKEEVAKVILFMLSDWSSMINGVTLPIDGGLIL